MALYFGSCGKRICASIPPKNASQATPVISVDSSGLITATATQDSGYVASGTTLSTHQLAFQPAKTIVPSLENQVAMSSGYYAGGDIIVLGDSNLVSENIKNGVNIFGITGTLEETSGSDEQSYESEDGIVQRTIESYVNPRASVVGSCAFMYCASLKNVEIPNCLTIQVSGFGFCSSLATVSAPKVTTIAQSAFGSCKALQSINLPSCKTILNNAFTSCTSLSIISAPNITALSAGVFQSCSKLTAVDFPLCTTLASTVFSGCTSLTTVNMPLIRQVGSQAFRACTNLTNTTFTACSVVGVGAFSSCTSLQSLDLPTCSMISASAFNGCSKLMSVILGSAACAKLSNTNVFTNTPMSKSSYTGAFGSIFVPASLVDTYKAATNWAMYSSRITSMDSV